MDTHTHTRIRTRKCISDKPSIYLNNTTLSRFKKKVMYQCVTTAVDRVPKAKTSQSTVPPRYIDTEVRYLPSMYCTVYRLDNTSASSPVDHKKKIKKVPSKMPTPPSRPSNAPATRMAAVFFFFLPVFCSGFHVGGKVYTLQ